MNTSLSIDQSARLFRLEINDAPVATLHAVPSGDGQSVTAAVVCSRIVERLNATEHVLDWVCAVFAARFPGALLQPMPLAGVTGYVTPQAHCARNRLPVQCAPGSVAFTFEELAMPTAPASAELN